MIGQTQIVIAGEINHLPAIKTRDRFTSGFEHAQTLVGAGLAPRLDLLG
jgi:hypothetical protein